MADVTTNEAVAAPKGPSPPLSTDGARSTRNRSPQKPLTPTTRSTRSSTMSAHGANGGVNGATANGALHTGPGSASGSASGARTTPQSTKLPQSQTTSPQRTKSLSASGTGRRRKPLFVSCVAYPETKAPFPVAPAAKDGAEPQRSQRKSKVEALNKIDRGGTPSTVIAEPAATSFVPPPPRAGPSITRNPIKRPRVANPPFNLNSVRTTAPVLDTHPIKGAASSASNASPPRAFGLPTCPTYHPTMEQFADPMAYIESISPEAKAYGICKIVPPEGWHMPFTLDSDKFSFMTRLQRLNSIGAASRAKINFLEQLSMFHKQQGDAGAHVPIINHKLLDVWHLRKEVNSLGGIDEVNRLKAWPNITELLGFTQSFMPQIKAAYTKLILPFENWALRAKSYPESPLTPLPNASANGKVASAPAPHGTPDTPMGAKQQGRMTGMRTSPRGRTSTLGTGGGSALAAALTMSPPDNLAAGPSSHANSHPAAPPSSDSGLAAPIRIKVSGFQTSSHGSDSELSEEEYSRTASHTSTPPQQDGKYEKGDVCEICALGNNAAKILLCDGCDRGFHTFCLDPPISAIPTNEWYCTACLLGNGDDFGFDEGEEHSLASFQARDSAFSSAWFNRYAQVPLTRNVPGPLTRTMGNVIVSEADVEREFWRLVESQDDTVEVEYGADVHSTTHGSAAPTTETHPTNKYARDPWNLNNMAIVRNSLLRYIKSDISGMTVPWIYVGMLFSAFCWHNEDHYTYSVNYMFWGETKTWYGIPGDSAELFEDAMRKEAPELFERQPSLLYQLVTIMNPGRLKEAGVPMYACDQRPNEFVITFPKAYHCGFNHGLNFNEAVNFALPDWLAHGKESVERYREHAKQPVFSHEELVITITLYSSTIETALWLQDILKLVVNEETNRRRRLREAVPDLGEALSEVDVPEEQYQCYVCKGFCYLAQITCTCTKLVTCLDHQGLLCACESANRTLRKRYSDEQLEDIRDTVVARASQPEQWQNRFDTALLVARPQLKTIRQLVADGERIPYDLPGLDDLREFMSHVNNWVERASAVCARKSVGRRRKGRQNDTAVDEEVDRSPEALRALIKEADLLSFDSPEILQLRQLVASMEDFRYNAETVLSRPENELSLEQVSDTIILGQSLNIKLPELERLSLIAARLEWYEAIKDLDIAELLDMDEIEKLIAEAKAAGIQDDNASLVELRNRHHMGDGWLQDVDWMFHGRRDDPEFGPISIDTITMVIDQRDTRPTSVDKINDLEDLRKTARSWEQSARSLINTRGSTVAATRLCKAVSTACGGPLGRIELPNVEQLQAELTFANSWLDSVSKAFGNVTLGKLPGHIAGLLLEMQEHLQPEDDEPNDKHACFCRAPPAGHMITCPLCAGEYHPKCVGISAKTPQGIQTAALNFKCQMCENLQYDDRPTSNVLGQLVDPVKWNVGLTVPGFEALAETVKLATRYAQLVLPLYEPACFMAAKQQHPSYNLAAHYLRKIWTLPIEMTAVRSELDPQTLEIKFEEMFFEQWLQSCLHGGFGDDTESGGKTKGSGKTRARKPKFTFARAAPHTFTCICRTEPLDHLLTVSCSKCEQGFHMSCVGAPISATAAEAKWRCPFCTIKAGKAPARLDIRCQMPDKIGTDQFIDWRQTIFTYADEPIPVTLSLVNDPARPTVILEVSKFTPPSLPDNFERPVWTEAEELGTDKRKRRRTGDAPSVASTPGPVLQSPKTPGPVLTRPPSTSAATISANQPAQNVRSNGSLFYATHSAVPWENTDMFTQFQINKADQPGPARTHPNSAGMRPTASMPIGAIVPATAVTGPPGLLAGTSVVPPRAAPPPARPVQAVQAAPMQAAPPAQRHPVPSMPSVPVPVFSPPPPIPFPPAAARVPVPVASPVPAPSPSVAVASPIVTPAPAPASVQVPVVTPAPALAAPAPAFSTVPAKRPHPADLDLPLPPVKRHSAAPPQAAN